MFSRDECDHSAATSLFFIGPLQNATALLDTAGIAVITPAMINGGSIASCGIDSMWVFPDTLTCADAPSATVQLFVLDSLGNLDSCTAGIALLDQVPPVVYLPGHYRLFGWEWTASITAVDIDGGSYDNCGIGPGVAFPDNFNCTQSGINLVDLFLNDITGNFGTCTATVTVEDTIPPVTICPGDTTLFLPADTCEILLPDFTLTNTLPLANSSGDFSNVQGQAGWYYGAYAAFQYQNFTPLPNFSTFWYGNEAGDTPFLDVNGGHPGANTRRWAVRRWISNFAGQIDISGGYLDLDGTCGNGASVRILQNGISVFAALNIPTSSTPYNFSITVGLGDTLDFAIDPGVNANCDHTFFTAIITADPPLQVIDNCGVDSIFSFPLPGNSNYSRDYPSFSGGSR